MFESSFNNNKEKDPNWISDRYSSLLCLKSQSHNSSSQDHGYPCYYYILSYQSIQWLIVLAPDQSIDHTNRRTSCHCHVFDLVLVYTELPLSVLRNTSEPWTALFFYSKIKPKKNHQSESYHILRNGRGTLIMKETWVLSLRPQKTDHWLVFLSCSLLMNNFHRVVSSVILSSDTLYWECVRTLPIVLQSKGDNQLQCSIHVYVHWCLCVADDSTSWDSWNYLGFQLLVWI